jgi:acetyl-CoA acyltransferase
MSTTRAVIVCGSRTPFTGVFGPFKNMDSIDLGCAAVDGLLKKTGIDAEQVDALFWGGVVLPPLSPNVGREIVIDLKLPPQIQAKTVSRACASGLQAITDAVAAIENGDAEVIIAGGGDSSSNVSLTLPPEVMRAVGPYGLGKAGLVATLKKMLGLLPFKWLPKQPAVAERSTGETMGDSAERMAKENDIPRQAQDELAARSQANAAAAWENGKLAAEVTPVTTPSGKVVDQDLLMRPGVTLQKLSRLRPAFDKKSGKGTLTAGNSSALTDGAAAVLIMSEAKAAELGMTPLAAIKSWSYVGVDPADQLLIGPAIAMPKALQKAGLTMADMDVIDIHEAFAAQVLSVTQKLGDAEWCSSQGCAESCTVDETKLNILGGSIALGHPFAATGARMVTTMANELHRSGKKYAVIGICAAGGLGAAAVLERVGGAGE